MRSRSFVFAFLSILAGSACGRGTGGPQAAKAGPTLVRVAAVSRETLTPPVLATGTLGPKDEIALSFKVGGVVSAVRVDAGAAVHAGELLATLDQSEIDAAVTRARSAADKADRDLARARRLYGDSVVTLVQVQDASTAADVAHADLTTASFNRRYAMIVAPSAGVILSRQAEPRELVAPGKTVLSLGSDARGSVVRVGLSDRDAVRVARGDRAVVRFDALPDRELEGLVSEIGAAAEPSTGTYAVEIELPKGAGAPALARGLIGRVEIHPRSGQLALWIPVESLLEADDGTGTVYVLSTDGAHAERRRVSIGLIAEDRVAVLRGLEGVTRVVTDGAAYLRDGAAVKVTP